jgi:hypothetical protein
VACAEKVTVYCGPESISWNELQAVCDVVKEAREGIRDHIYHDMLALVFSLMRGGPNILTISDYSHASFSEDKFPLLFELLRLHMSKLSTEPEDKVYGLVGISSDRNSFSIGYGRSIRSTYIYMGRHIISATQNLDLICLQQMITTLRLNLLSPRLGAQKSVPVAPCCRPPYPGATVQSFPVLSSKCILFRKCGGAGRYGFCT